MELKWKGRQSLSIWAKKRQKQAKLEDTEDYSKLLGEKLQTEDGKLHDPKTLSAWTNNFLDIPEFTFGDLYSYPVGREEYPEEVWVKPYLFH